MKKLFTLFAAITLSIVSYAQYGSRSVMLTDEGSVFHTPVETAKGVAAEVKNPLGFLNAPSTAEYKKTGTIGQSRWYSYYYTIDQLLGGTFTGTSPLYTQIPIWNDSAVTQLFYDGTKYYYGAINFCGIAQVIDPIHFQSYRDTDLLNNLYGVASGAGQLLQVTDTNTYSVDSVRMQASYVRISSKPSIVDTLIVSVAPCNHAYVYGETAWPMVHDIDLGADTALVGFAPIAVDSDARAAFSEVPAFPEKKWKIILTAADGDTSFSVGGVSGYDSIKTYTYAVPGSVKIPHGYDFVVTATFKSGQPVSDIKPGVDSFEEYNHWMPISGYEYARPTGGYMTYWYNSLNDQNSSNMLFPKKTSYYEPTIYVQAHNNNKNFDYQYHNIQAFVSCATCPSITYAPADTAFHHQGGIRLAVGNVHNVIGSVEAYPNPASVQVALPFTLKQNANVNIYLSNAIGQIVNSQNLGNVLTGRAIFNVNNLSNGIYFYTLVAGGERYTGRIAVAH